MSAHIYKILEIVGTSATSVEDAIQTAVAKAAKTVHNLRWFEVTQTRGDIVDGKVTHFQVTMKIGFTLDDR